MTAETGGPEAGPAPPAAGVTRRTAQQLIGGTAVALAIDRGCARIPHAGAAGTPPALLRPGPGVVIGQVRHAIDAGRWRRDPRGWVRATAPDQPRHVFAADGTLAGILFEPAATYFSANFHEPDGGPAAANHIVKTIAGDSIAGAGTHPATDRFGTHGGCVLLTQGAVAGGAAYPPNIAQSFVAGDIAQQQLIFHFPQAPGAAGSITSMVHPLRGVAPGGSLTLSYDAAGTLTGCTASGGYDSGHDLVETTADGRPVYLVWMSYHFVGSGTITPLVRLPQTAVPGFAVAIHEMRLLRNPPGRPSAVPVLAAAQSFRADAILIAPGAGFEILFDRLAVGRSRVDDGRISAPLFRSGPVLPYETGIRVDRAVETRNTDFFLPSGSAHLNFRQRPGEAILAVSPGPGRYDVTLTADVPATRYTVRGPFSDPLRWPMIRAVAFSRSHIDSLDWSNAVLFAWASTITAQPGQIIAFNQTIGAGRQVWRDFVVASHPFSHSRVPDKWLVHGRVPGGAEADYVGAFGGIINAPSTISMTRGAFYRCGTGPLWDNGGKTNPITVYLDQLLVRELTSDFLKPARGCFTLTVRRCTFDKAMADIWNWVQGSREIQLDIGAGLQDLSATPLAAADLPTTRQFTLIGRRATPDGPIMREPPPFRHSAVATQYLRDGAVAFGTSADKPGYQFGLTMIDVDDPATGRYRRRPINGEVYGSTGAGPPSLANPHIHLTYEGGHWSDAATYVATSTDAAGTVTRLTAGAGTGGTHPDLLQSGSNNCILDTMLFERNLVRASVQGLFIENYVAPPRDAILNRLTVRNNIMAVNLRNVWGDNGAGNGTPHIYQDNIVFWLDRENPQANGVALEPCFWGNGAKVHYQATNNWHQLSATQTGVLMTHGATITAPPNKIIGPHMTHFNQFSVPAPVQDAAGTLVAPTVFQTVAAGGGHITDRGYFSLTAPLATLRFTSLFERLSGIAANRTVAECCVHDRLEPLFARIAAMHQLKGKVVVSNRVAVGTVLFTGVAGRLDRYHGDGQGGDGPFTVAAGTVTVTAPLTGIDDLFLLYTTAGATYLVDVTA